MDKTYIQEDYNIKDTLNHIGIDSIDQAEAICGRAVYALELDYYDGDLANVKAVHNYEDVSSSNTTQLTETSSSRLLPDILESVIYLRAGSSLALYLVCCDYHSGQSSYGYYMLCRLQKHIKRLIGDYHYNIAVNAPEKIRQWVEYPQWEKINEVL